MCGRFTLRTPAAQLAEHFPLFDMPAPEARYNIAPSQMVAAIRQQPDESPHGVRLRWGLIPSWATDAKIGYRLINARSESIKSKPAFRAAFKKRRCLILADGFYEWKKQGRAKQPFHIHMKDDRPFAFAGLWEHWDKEERPIDSCTIITTDANEVLQPLHDRMPAILDPRDYERWLDPNYQDPAPLLEMLRPYDARAMSADAANPYVNKAGNEGPECLAQPEGDLF